MDLQRRVAKGIDAKSAKDQVVAPPLVVVTQLVDDLMLGIARKPSEFFCESRELVPTSPEAKPRSTYSVGRSQLVRDFAVDVV